MRLGINCIFVFHLSVLRHGFFAKKFDVIFVPVLSPVLSALPTIFLSWLWSRPVVLWIQDLWPESLLATGYIKSPLVLNFVKKIVRFIYQNADLLLVQSKAFFDPVSALASGTPIEYYPNSVDIQTSIRSSVTLPDLPGLDVRSQSYLPIISVRHRRLM